MVTASFLDWQSSERSGASASRAGSQDMGK
jgi:hypothetical protein